MLLESAKKSASRGRGAVRAQTIFRLQTTTASRLEKERQAVAHIVTHICIYIYIYSKRTQLCALLLSLKVAGEKTTQLKDVDTHQRKISELLCCNQNQEWSAPHDNHHQTHDALSMYLGRIRAMRPKGIRKLNSLYPPTTDDECKYGENTS